MLSESYKYRRLCHLFHTHSQTNMNFSTLIAISAVVLASTVSAGWIRPRPTVVQNNIVQGPGTIAGNNLVSNSGRNFIKWWSGIPSPSTYCNKFFSFKPIVVITSLSYSFLHVPRSTKLRIFLKRLWKPLFTSFGGFGCHKYFFVLSFGKPSVTGSWSLAAYLINSVSSSSLTHE